MPAACGDTEHRTLGETAHTAYAKTTLANEPFILANDQARRNIVVQNKKSKTVCHIAGEGENCASKSRDDVASNGIARL
jgi:hypothetical protein